MTNDASPDPLASASKGELLLVTYHFPPIRSAGIYRMVGFARRLRDEGWRVHVLTVRRSRFDLADPETLSLVPPGVAITRTRMNDALASLFGTPAPPPKPDQSARQTHSRPRYVRLARRALRPLRRMAADILGFPDRRVGWTLPLLAAVYRHLRECPGAVVLSSSPPHSSHLALAALRRIRRFPWVADFRDPWTAPPRTRSRFSIGLHRVAESFVLRGADHVLANTDGNRRALLERFRFLSPDRVTTVTNAYDAYYDRDDVSVELHGGDFVYVGEVYPGLLDGYLDAVEWLLRNDRPVPTLDIYGEMSVADREAVSRRQLGGYVRYQGTLTYPESLAAMKSAKALLLVLRVEPGWRTWVPSKLYSYLFSGRPILALGPHGDAAEIIERTGAGRVVGVESTEAVASQLRTFLDEIESTDWKCDHRALDEFTIEETTRRVDRILSRVGQREG